MAISYSNAKLAIGAAFTSPTEGGLGESMKLVHRSIIACFLIASCASVFAASPAAADDSNSEMPEDSKIYLYGFGGGSLNPPNSKFRKSISGEPELTQPTQWGFPSSLYYCHLIKDSSSEYFSKAVNYLIGNYIKKYNFKENINLTEVTCNQYVDIFIIDSYYVGLLKNGAEKSQYYSEYKLKSARRFFENRAYYGILAAYNRSPLDNIAEMLAKRDKKTVQDKIDSREELNRLAQEGSREKIYYVNFGDAREQMKICAVLKFNEDNSPIYGVANLLGGVYNNKFKIRQKLSGEFRDLNSFWASVNLRDNGSYANRGISPCNVFIDYAQNANIVLKALESNGVKPSFAGFNALEVSAKYRGFDNVSDYKSALKIGADNNEYSRLKNRGVYNLENFQSAVSEMNRTGYLEGNNIRDVLNYLDDKFEGASIGRSAVWVKAQRNKQEAAEARSAEIEYRNCLSNNGYYRTKNSTAKRAIERKCS